MLYNIIEMSESHRDSALPREEYLQTQIPVEAVTESSSTNPGYYQSGRFQVWDMILLFDLGFLEGNIIKYVCRWRKKNGVEDLKKARTYLDKLIREAEAGREK